MSIRFAIYYKKLFANDTIITNENKNSPILTLGVASNESFIIDSKDNILNINGEIAAIVHQYDRHKNIVIKVMKKYCNDLMEKNTLNIFTFNIFIFLIIVLYKLKKNHLL